MTLAPDSGPAHRLLARALLQQNRIAEAIDEYQRAHRLDPNLPGLEEELALVEASHEKPQAAAIIIAKAKELTKRQPKNAFLHNVLGAAYLANNDFAKAEKAFQKALRLNPRMLMARVNLAQTYAAQNQADQAWQEIHHVLKVNPRHVVANTLAGQLAGTQGRVQEGIRYLETAREVNPSLIRVNLALARLYLARDRLADAHRLLHKILKAHSRLADGHFLKGVLASKRGDSKEALVAFKEAVRLDPSLTEAFFGLGNAYNATGARSRAVEAYQKVTALDSRHFGALNNLAWIYAQEEGNLNEALVLATKALELQPENGRILDTLGYILYRQGKLDQAEARLKEALRVLPHEASILYHLGLVAHAQGRNDEAITAIQRALLSNPDFDEAHEARLLLKQLSG